jgi:SAM-dependent methyltransferase
MTAEIQTTPAAHAGELLQRGAERVPGSPQGGWRGFVRRTVLRAMRPYTHHQREVDVELVAAVQRVWEAQEHVAERHAEQIERLEKLARELILTAESLRRMAAGAEARAGAAAAGIESIQQTLQRSLVPIQALADELHELPYMADDLFASFDTPVGKGLGFRARASSTRAPSSPGRSNTAEGPGAAALPTEKRGGSGAGYAAFEDIFRGPAERVVESQRPYLPLLREHQPVLDVGCGRGELLAMLAQEGIVARGVDGDGDMVARCHECNLDVVQGDVNAYLEGVEDGTLGTIFSAQVIEHLPYAELQRLLSLSLKKLRPGGLLIAETVNPHRVASLKSFWVDLTHQHPIFPEVALALCGIAGFAQAYVFAPGYDDYVQARFQAPAYAVVASAPGCEHVAS